MSWVREAREALEAGREAKVRPIGGSMRGRIESGQLVTLRPRAPGEKVEPNSAVFVRWGRGNYLLHLALEVDGGRVLVGNNVGKVNGWADEADVLGVVVAVEP